MSPSDNDNYNPPSPDAPPPEVKIQERIANRKDDPDFSRDEPANPHRGLRDEVIMLWKTVLLKRWEALQEILHPNSDISQLIRKNSDEVEKSRVRVCKFGIHHWPDEQPLLWQFCIEVSMLALLSTFSPTGHSVDERREWRDEIVKGVDMPNENWGELWPSE